MSEELINYCKFCGQILLDGNDCKCPGATEEREIKRRINNAKTAIDNMFVNYVMSDSVAPPE